MKELRLLLVSMISEVDDDVDYTPYRPIFPSVFRKLPAIKILFRQTNLVSVYSVIIEPNVLQHT